MHVLEWSGIYEDDHLLAFPVPSSNRSSHLIQIYNTYTITEAIYYRTELLRLLPIISLLRVFFSLYYVIVFHRRGQLSSGVCCGVCRLVAGRKYVQWYNNAAESGERMKTRFGRCCHSTGEMHINF